MNNQTPSVWTIDTGHSTIGFKVKHLAIAHVSGVFNAFSGRVQTHRDDFDEAQVELEIDSTSLTTNNNERDTHLKSDLFFDVQHFPKLTFKGLLHKRADDCVLTGELTIRDISRNVTLATVFMGTGKGRFGDVRAGFELTGLINRTDFGLSWSLLTEVGGFVVGEEIKLHMDIELIKA